MTGAWPETETQREVKGRDQAGRSQGQAPRARALALGTAPQSVWVTSLLCSPGPVHFLGGFVEKEL